jgi:hypothetical protein
MISKEEYSRTATQDVRGAMASALAEYVAGLVFQLDDGNTLKFAQVFAEWPSYLNRAVDPSACILPGSWKYGDALLTPTLLESTWEPQGGDGWGLYQTAEAEVELELSFRATNTVERGQLILGLEEAFQHTEVLMNQQGAANRIVLPLTTYYGLSARYSLLSGRSIDSEEQAMREQRDAILTISAQAPKVKLGPVHPMSLTIRKLSVDETPIT